MKLVAAATLLLVIQQSYAHSSQISALRNALLAGYDKDAKPDGQTEVKVGLRITNMDLCPHKQQLKWNGWIMYMWTDERLAWDSDDFGGLDRIRINAKHIWIPDVTVYNSVGEPKPNYLAWDDMTNAVIMKSGMVIFVPPVLQKTHCDINYVDFPWGEQNCTIKVGSWTYDKSMLNIKPYLSDNHDYPESALTFDHFLNSNMKIEGSSHIREEKVYPCCPGEYYPSITMSVAFKHTKMFKDNTLMTP